MASVFYLFRDALKKVMGPEMGVFLLVVAVIGGLRWMPVARLVRAQFLSLREKEFVEAARGLGARPLRQVVRHILASLPPRQRAAMVLTELLGFTSKEAGDALGVTDATIRSLTRHGRDAFRKVMEVDDA